MYEWVNEDGDMSVRTLPEHGEVAINVPPNGMTPEQAVELSGVPVEAVASLASEVAA